MNILSRSLLITCLCSITAYAAHVTILEKQIDLGKDPKTQKAIVVKACGFVEGNAKETSDTRWMAVFPYGNELMFFSTQNGVDDLFAVTNIITAQQAFTVSIDPTAQDPIVDKQTSKESDDSTSLVTMEVTINHQVQMYKDLLILIAKGSVKALEAFVNKHSLKTINEVIENALDCQGTCYIECDNKEAFESLMQAKKPVTSPVTFTGKLTFVPMQAILEQILAEAAQNEQNPLAKA